MAKFPPLFKRVTTDPQKEGKLIAEVQEEFEKFWSKLAKKCPVNSERTMAMRKMQEACMWMGRAIALSGFNPDFVPKYKTPKKGYPDDLGTFSHLPDGCTLMATSKANPDVKTQVIIKKKREIVVPE
jgi:hypothetical protein